MNWTLLKILFACILCPCSTLDYGAEAKAGRRLRLFRFVVQMTAVLVRWAGHSDREKSFRIHIHCESLLSAVEGLSGSEWWWRMCQRWRGTEAEMLWMAGAPVCVSWAGFGCFRFLLFGLGLCTLFLVCAWTELPVSWTISWGVDSSNREWCFADGD